MIDAAKGIALLAGNGGTILDYEGVDRMALPIPPMVMVPSTSGTGADVSQFCIVTDTARNTKITILGRALVPDMSIVDPHLLTTMPDWLNAATGLDALTHGIEAYVSRAHNPLTDHHALQAIALVGEHLERTMDHPGDEAARTCMAQAALEAGLAFTNAILGAAHAMSHQVGGLLDLPHGVINGVLLPHVIRFNAERRPAPLRPHRPGAGPARHHHAGLRRRGRRGRGVGGARGPQAGRRARGAQGARRDRRRRVRHRRALGDDAGRRLPLDQPARGRPGGHRDPVPGGDVVTTAPRGVARR